MPKSEFDLRLGDIFRRSLETELSLMAPVAGQAVCDEARKRFNTYFEELGIGGGDEEKMQDKELITKSSQETLENALKWANERLASNSSMSKEETILVERIVMISADIVKMSHFRDHI